MRERRERQRERFIRLTCTFCGYIVSQRPFTGGEAENPIAQQARSLRTQGSNAVTQSEAEGLEAPWRATGASLHSKAKESEF
jgi:hypothetical protein